MRSSLRSQLSQTSISPYLLAKLHGRFAKGTNHHKRIVPANFKTGQWEKNRPIGWTGWPRSNENDLHARGVAQKRKCVCSQKIGPSVDGFLSAKTKASERGSDQAEEGSYRAPARLQVWGCR